MMQDLEPFYGGEGEEEEGGEMLRGILHRAHDGQGWQVAGIHLNRFLAKYLGRKVMMIFGATEASEEKAPARQVCDTCGFPLDNLGGCARCQWFGAIEARRRREELFRTIDQIVERCWADPYTG